MNTIEEITKDEKMLSSRIKNDFSIHFLNKKRFKLEENNEEIIVKLKEDRPYFFISLKNKNIYKNFLEAFSLITNNPKSNYIRYFLKAKKKYFNSSFNLKLINKIIDFFSEEESNLRNANISSPEDLIILVKTFLINELEFSVFTLLTKKYISNINTPLNREDIYYLGLYAKYISSYDYRGIFHEMINTDINYKIWYFQYKEFLNNINTSLIKINRGNKIFLSYKYNYEMFDFNSMTDIVNSSQKEKNEINENNKNKTNIGKKVNVIIVYQEESSQENTNYIDNSESSHNNDIEIAISD